MAKEKEPISGANESGSGVNNVIDDSISTSNNNISDDESSIKSQCEIMEQDEEDPRDANKGRHFWFVIYPTEAWVREHFPDCQYDGSEGWGTAPDDWRDRLRETGLTFCVSPFHYLDRHPNGWFKKPHWHVIVSWGNTTTYRSARQLCIMLCCPRPVMLKNPSGAYRYHQHLDDPDKYQYTDRSETYNGWTRPLDTAEVNVIMQEIREILFELDCRDFAELATECMSKGAEYYDVLSNHTHFFDRMCAGYRNNPVRNLQRYYASLTDKDEEKRAAIAKRIKEIETGIYEKWRNL